MIFEVPEPQKSYPCVHRDTIFTFSRFREKVEKVLKNEVQKSSKSMKNGALGAQGPIFGALGPILEGLENL